MACMALHNFIKQSAMADEDFEKCDLDESYIPLEGEASSSRANPSSSRHGDEDHNMNVFRDAIADGLFNK